MSKLQLADKKEFWIRKRPLTLSYLQKNLLARLIQLSTKLLSIWNDVIYPKILLTILISLYTPNSDIFDESNIEIPVENNEVLGTDEQPKITFPKFNMSFSKKCVEQIKKFDKDCSNLKCDRCCNCNIAFLDLVLRRKKCLLRSRHEAQTSSFLR